MKRLVTSIALTAAVVATSSCSAVRGEQSESNFGSDDVTSVVFEEPESAEDTGSADTEPPVPTVDVGTESVFDEGSANEAIDFVTMELYSQSSVAGLDLFGNGPVIATFVQPGCQFSNEQSQLLADAADAGSDVTYVFVHSGGDQEAFMSYTDEMGLAQENMIHIDDANGDLSFRFGVDAYPSTLLVNGAGQLSASSGALDADRLEQALAIVTS